ncbi:MAG: lamin tail domain-containing protein [Chitinophagaceae bacterium]|nr:lamin tail domain-containing protein [Chitinophagaceae bacterium]
MRKSFVFVFIIACLFSATEGLSQVKESFNDGNFTTDPAWLGNTSDWIVNSNLQLQSNNTVANSSFYLSTTSTLALQAQWEFTVNLQFNTSSTNYADVYLIASQSNLTSTTLTGYFVRIGNTDDEISLYRKDVAGVPVKIIDGINAVTNTSNNNIKIRVTRSAANVFTLYRDLTATGNSFVAEGSATDATYTTAAFFGFYVKQSTASFFQRHYFDDIDVTTFTPDVTPPAIQSVTATSPKTLEVIFTEAIDKTTAEVAGNYSVNNSLGTPVTATKDANNPALVQLTFANSFTNNVNNTITINGVKDLAGNAMVTGPKVFSYFVPQRFDVLIDEIMADPTPVVQLPNAEFIEIKNTSTQQINLQGWHVESTSSASGLFPSYLLPPDSFLIITGTGSASLFANFGRVMGITSFPSLDNTGSTLTLYAKDNSIIHAVAYNASWYQNAVKSNGGWSLEMIDIKNPCSGISNWTASTDSQGGTPGSKNSVDGSNADKTAPVLIKAVATDATHLVVTFNEPTDIFKAANPGNYTISDGINKPISALPVAPLYTQVQLFLSTPLARGKVYTITVSGVTDCSGNSIGSLNTVRAGLAEKIDTMDIVVNEILFNPAPTATDYVEIYNRSNKILDAKDLYITNRSSASGQLGTLKQLTTDNLLIFPGEYYVISEDETLVKKAYVIKNPGNFINVSSMPSYPDDKGVVVLLNAQGTIVDELQYDSKWHFALLDNKEGISLERIDYNKPTQNKDNWHSAASTAGFGTPSYQNSQFRLDVQVQGTITVTPKIFSPDNDGTDDFTTLSYQMTELGYVANITIFDASGRPVRYLAKNATLGLQGNFRWDGLDDKMNKLTLGTYVFYTEVFNLNGKKKSYKYTVVLARRF